MPAIAFADHPELYRQAFSTLLNLPNSTYRTRPTRVLVVDRRQLQALAERKLVPSEQLQRFIAEGLLPASANGA